MRARPTTRVRILDGALSVFAAKGYHRATVDDIVRAPCPEPRREGACYDGRVTPGP